MEDDFTKLLKETGFSFGDFETKPKPKKEENTNNLWLPIFLTLLTFNNTSNIPLEKEISYLQGKVNTLEKLIF